MHPKNQYLIPKTDFTALLARASQSTVSKADARTELWFELADQVQANWDGMSESFFDSLTPGQYALLCTAELHRTTKQQDFVSFVGYTPRMALRAFKALEILRAEEYLNLLKEVQEVFPNQQFPEYAEDLMHAIQKLPLKILTYFDKVGARFLTGKGMKRPLHDYVFAYITNHPDDFCTA